MPQDSIWQEFLKRFLILGWTNTWFSSKKFHDSPLHRIFRRMHGALNIDENKNWLHSLAEIYETNLLSLVNLW